MYARIMQLINEATETGEAIDNGVTVRRCKQRADHTYLHHKSAYSYRFYVNGKRVSQAHAEHHLGA